MRCTKIRYTEFFLRQDYYEMEVECEGNKTEVRKEIKESRITAGFGEAK